MQYRRYVPSVLLDFGYRCAFGGRIHASQAIRNVRQILESLGTTSQVRTVLAPERSVPY